MIVLTPRFAPAYQAAQCNSFGLCTPVSHPSYGYRVARPRPQPRRVQPSPFNSFFNQIDALLSEIDQESQRQAQLEAHLEAQREAHRQQQQRERALRARFAVTQNEQGWQVDGDVHGFDQENINIDVTDEHTLKITGNTQWQPEKSHLEAQQSEHASTPALEELVKEVDTAITRPASPDSDTQSHKSYQATVEDDFEDLGAETSSLLSASTETSTPAESVEPKGKEPAVEKPTTTEIGSLQQPRPEETQQQEQIREEERVHGTFERTFRFPERIDVSNISASFMEGVLKITVPRAQALQSRRITIL